MIRKLILLFILTLFGISFIPSETSASPNPWKSHLGNPYNLRHLSTGGEVYWMESTAYSAYDYGCGSYTATGDLVRYGIAAVDPDVIPLGTNLIIDGYGEAIAADTGGAIIGYRIDLAFDSYQEAINWGRRFVNVYIQ